MTTPKGDTNASGKQMRVCRLKLVHVLWGDGSDSGVWLKRQGASACEVGWVSATSRTSISPRLRIRRICTKRCSVLQFRLRRTDVYTLCSTLQGLHPDHVHTRVGLQVISDCHIARPGSLDQSSPQGCTLLATVSLPLGSSNLLRVSERAEAIASIIVDAAQHLQSMYQERTPS